jgi:hypothetical protein
MKLTEGAIENTLHSYINECDVDELARICGDIFGGKCFPSIDYQDTYEYDFEPNEFYTGEFGKEDLT